MMRVMFEPAAAVAVSPNSTPQHHGCLSSPQKQLFVLKATPIFTLEPPGKLGFLWEAPAAHV
jgi:hypothetical protein